MRTVDCRFRRDGDGWWFVPGNPWGIGSSRVYRVRDDQKPAVEDCFRRSFRARMVLIALVSALVMPVLVMTSSGTALGPLGPLLLLFAYMAAIVVTGAVAQYVTLELRLRTLPRAGRRIGYLEQLSNRFAGMPLRRLTLVTVTMVVMAVAIDGLTVATRSLHAIPAAVMMSAMAALYLAMLCQRRRSSPET